MSNLSAPTYTFACTSYQNIPSGHEDEIPTDDALHHRYVPQIEVKNKT
jgi:hypothetical protein